MAPIAVGAKDVRFEGASGMDSLSSPQPGYAISGGPIPIRYLFSNTSDQRAKPAGLVLAAARGPALSGQRSASTDSGLALIALGFSLVGGAVFMRRKMPG